jgi:alkylated DNA repair dioxygenase AlkB
MEKEKRGQVEGPRRNLLPDNGEAWLISHFLDDAEATRCMNALIEEISWKQEPIKIFGKTVLQPRLTAWYGDAGKGYSYSGIVMTPRPWTGTLLSLKKYVEVLAGTSFNSALLNLYRDGKDSMGWHRDNEKELGVDPIIASLTLGTTRQFRFRDYKEKSRQIEVELTHGSLLLMKGATQHHWEHSLPKTAREVGPRINITFRIIT